LRKRPTKRESHRRETGNEKERGGEWRVDGKNVEERKKQQRAMSEKGRDIRNV
jgi:hypothetical protein